MANSIDADYPADECFKAFIEAFKDENAKVEIEAEDWENRTTTMSLRSSHHILMTRFKTFKIITTITPQEDDNSSHVKWTIEAEKIDDTLVPDLFVDTALFIHDMIKEKLPK